MDWKTKTGTGSVLAILGAASVALGPTIGVTELARPWSFIAGFVTGILAGMGAVLTISGLLDRRRGDGATR